VLDHLNAGTLELGLFALAFGGLQIWWIGSTIQRRKRAQPLNEKEFRRTLERIWREKP
jgi:hypothetical protein